jgi:Zn ribbon nucleic-acid-binding protein
MKSEKYICPECSAQEAVKIYYGYPTEDTLQKWFKKEVELGGCIVGGEIPNRKCIKCNYEWKTNDND